MVAPETLVLLAVALGSAAPTGQIAPTTTPATAVSACRSDYASGVDLDDRTSRAVHDIRACARAGTVAPRGGRRALAAIAQLQDSSAYDRRRGWGTLGHPRERRADARLAAIMAAAGIVGPSARLGASTPH